MNASNINRALHSMVFVVVLLGGVAGCGVMPTVREAVATADKVNNDIKEIGDGAASAMKVKPAAKKPVGFFVGARPIIETRKSGVIATRAMVFNESYGNLNEVMEALVREGVPIRMARDRIDLRNLGFSASINGRVSDVLDAISNRYNIYWTEENGQINISSVVTRVLRVTTLAGAAESNMRVSGDTSSGGSSGGGSSGGGSGGQSEQTTSFRSDQLNAYTSYEKQIKAMLSPIGEVAVSSASSTIVVTDTPEHVARVEAYVEEQNAYYEIQVALEVQILSVTRNKKDGLGFDWGALVNTLSNRYGLSINTQSNVSVSAGAFGFTIPTTATGGAAKYSGSQVVARALSEYNTVSELQSITLRAVNNRPIIRRNGNTQSFFPSIQSTQTSNAGTQTTSNAQRERLGFTLNFHPNATPDGKISFRLHLNDKNNAVIRTKTFGAANAQVTQEGLDFDELEIATEGFMRSGETMVLSGKVNKKTTSAQSGVGFAGNVLLGGENGSGDDGRVIVTITPVVIMPAQASR